MSTVIHQDEKQQSVVLKTQMATFGVQHLQTATLSETDVTLQDVTFGHTQNQTDKIVLSNVTMEDLMKAYQQRHNALTEDESLAYFHALSDLFVAGMRLFRDFDDYDALVGFHTELTHACALLHTDGDSYDDPQPSITDGPAWPESQAPA